MRYCIDVDNTICISSSGCDYSKCPPIQSVINKINLLYEEGHYIILFTARNMKTFNGDINKIHEVTKPILEKWLQDNGVRYNELIFGKPFCDVYVDDKNLSIEEFLKN